MKKDTLTQTAELVRTACKELDFKAPSGMFTAPKRAAKKAEDVHAETLNVRGNMTQATFMSGAPSLLRRMKRRWEDTMHDAMTKDAMIGNVAQWMVDQKHFANTEAFYAHFTNGEATD